MSHAEPAYGLWSTLLGFLFQWPTILSLMMLPFLSVMLGRLAIAEEREMQVQFGAGYDRYAHHTLRLWPRLF